MSEIRNSLPVSRRTFVGAAGAGALALGVPSLIGPGDARGDTPSTTAFRHGVASGDPLPNGVIIWTRVTPTAAATPGSGRGAPSTLTWEVASDKGFGSIVASGSTSTDASRDHTVKVDVAGLAPRTRYWYRFRVTGGPAAGAVSPIGRTRTAPAADADVASVKFGVVSCSNWEAGYFAAYRHLAKRTELDAVVHLGDYIYEYGAGEYGGKTGPVRRHEPAHDIVSLADYRIRHGQYKTDPDLRELHAVHPFIVTWDDHESADNSYRAGAENHNRRTQGSWAARKANADKAYYEWMPVRPVVTESNRHIYRRLRYGNLLELSMLDLRTYRDKEASRFSKRSDSDKTTITGRTQMEWITGGVTTSTTRWQLVGNSVMITPFLLPPLDPDTTGALTDLIGVPENGIPLNGDQWDGYTRDRATLLDAADRAGKRNVVFLTGDIHMSFANDIPRKAAAYPAAGTLGTEFVVTSVTSNNIDDMVKVPEHTVGNAASAAISATNNHIRWVDTDAHGYAVLTVDDAAARMDWYFVRDRADRRTGAYHGQAWQVRSGSRRVTRVR
ncbi:alkaline phosphatase D family protein [Gordonia hydrophobica]|uniref:Alkaline phosphatase D family protein n=1 Tax=Gordonia hydrophobica TaxID=40516 RepID=A0ABZ2U727_9ACTN|nr:alkaline phosphatase D family protein [Gordonia hydrophobica]MBM7365530.1 alkaline phosphatase D [Gordonia hydrophobica]